ncbi:flagellar protein FlaG [Eubacterium sp. MSJ-13]|uniref:flagellar protein FlaG n=1 Tax=Eubacterium sp. MSJ-13 TaxID=2841513 RepID=UPI001C119DAC|nr:flagellar protein FlaG [Eubacterium sp. MSJ-13]MBU5477766.1 flagellar protein FlaG [Eubacterium sp. MSJ-13]
MMDLDAIKPIGQKKNDNTDYNYNYNSYEDYAGQTSSNNTVKKVEQDNNIENNTDSDNKDDGISQKDQDDKKEVQQNVSQSTIHSSFAETNAKIKNTRLEYSVDDDTQRISIKVIDKDTDKCIREVPPEETLKALKKIWEIAGIIVDEKR